MEENESEDEKILKANRNQADEELKAALDKIRTKTLGELTEFEIKFLRARRTYLTATDKEKYGKILKGKKESEESEAPKKPEEAPVYVAKKDRK